MVRVKQAKAINVAIPNNAKVGNQKLRNTFKENDNVEPTLNPGMLAKVGIPVVGTPVGATLLVARERELLSPVQRARQVEVFTVLMKISHMTRNTSLLIPLAYALRDTIGNSTLRISDCLRPLCKEIDRILFTLNAGYCES